jgi:signal transduction histidine kinase
MAINGGAGATASQAFPVAGGDAGALIRSKDWRDSPLGPIESWPQSLRTTLDILLKSPFPMFLWWGPERIQFYNDGYRPSLGARKHPLAMGQRGEECWPEIWTIIGPMIDDVMNRGVSVWHEDQLIPIDRNGFMEEVFWTFSYSPVQAEDGTVGGTLVIVNETTERVQAERRLRTLRDLAAATTEAASGEDSCQRAAEILGNNRSDISFALLYLVERDGRSARLAATTGLEAGSPAAPTHVSFAAEATVPTWPVESALRSLSVQIVNGLASRFGPLPGGPWPEPAASALVVPIGLPAQAGHLPLGALVVGCSPRVPLTSAYEEFVLLVAHQLASALAHVRAYEEERRRAESLAELDRAKTVFFSNISHDFRTPLTLLLGPSQDLLTDLDDPLSDRQRELQLAIQRNARRLLKLVNTLLEFSRLEAGRVQAAFQLTDVPTFTAELAASFRSATERAQIELRVDTPSLPDGVEIYVDPSMWERVVLNLLSNALKFTLAGVIGISTRVEHDHLLLTVRDTGCGIAADQFPRLFERFHRIEGARSRTQEGSGIGLALVNELVKLHGGTVAVESELGVGSAFTVSIPVGASHCRRSLELAPRSHQLHGLGCRRWLDTASAGLASVRSTSSHPVGRRQRRHARLRRAPARHDL